MSESKETQTRNPSPTNLQSLRSFFFSDRCVLDSLNSLGTAAYWKTSLSPTAPGLLATQKSQKRQEAKETRRRGDEETRRRGGEEARIQRQRAVCFTWSRCHGVLKTLLTETNL